MVPELGPILMRATDLHLRAATADTAGVATAIGFLYQARRFEAGGRRQRREPAEGAQPFVSREAFESFLVDNQQAIRLSSDDVSGSPTRVPRLT